MLYIWSEFIYSCVKIGHNSNTWEQLKGGRCWKQLKAGHPADDKVGTPFPLLFSNFQPRYFTKSQPSSDNTSEFPSKFAKEIVLSFLHLRFLRYLKALKVAGPKHVKDAELIKHISHVKHVTFDTEVKGLKGPPFVVLVAWIFSSVSGLADHPVWSLLLCVWSAPITELMPTRWFYDRGAGEDRGKCWTFYRQQIFLSASQFAKIPTNSLTKVGGIVWHGRP